MKIFASSMAVTLAVLVFSCRTDKKETAETPLIFRNDPELASDIMTPEVLWSFGRIGDVQVSPSGEKILYGVSYYSIEQNKSNSELFVMQTDGSDKVRLTETPESEFNAVWHPDGERIVYLSSASGDVQAWMMDGNGGGKRQISRIEGGISSLAISPAGDRVLFTKDVKVDTTRSDLYPDLPKADARIITDLMYLHWDTWEDGAYSHIFVANFDGEGISGEKDIMPGEPFDTPLMPFGGMEEIAWSPDGKQIAYTCKKLYGKDYTLSTNSQIYLYDLDTEETVNMTQGMPGYDKAPLFSPDGKQLFWLSMERAGFEADRYRLFRLDLASGEKECLTPEFDHSPSGLTWGHDGNTLYFVAGVMATFQIFRLDVPTGMITAVTSGDHDYHSVAVAGDRLIATRVDMTKPEEIYSVDPATGEATEISFENKHILDRLAMPSVEKRWITTTDNKQMLTWVIYPPHFDSTQSYPALLYCEGGPQSALSQFWSYRWNFSQMASNGYIVVAPNRGG